MELERLDKEELILIVRRNLSVSEDELVREMLQERITTMLEELKELDHTRIQLKSALRGINTASNLYDEKLVKQRETLIWKLEEVEQQILFLKCQYRRLVEGCSDGVGAGIGT